MTNDLKVGDRVRLLRLNGTASDEAFPIHDLWGIASDTARNASFLSGGMEQFWHTDLMKREDDTTPIVIPDGGEWFIARGNNMGWGRAKTIDGAIRNMKRHGSVTAYTVHRVSKWTDVDGMGAFTYPIGLEPVEVRKIEGRKVARG